VRIAQGQREAEISIDTVALPVGHDSFMMGAQCRRIQCCILCRTFRQIVQQVGQPRNRANLQTELLLYILHSAPRCVDAVLNRFFLAIQRDDHRMRRGAGRFDERDRFAHRGTGRHHVVDDQHAALKLRPNQRAAFAVVFCFLSVVGHRQIAAEPRQFDDDGGRERNAFVRRAEHHVELQTAGGFFSQQTTRIELRQPAELGAIIEQTGVEKIRAQAPRLGLELPKTQHAGFDCELHEFLGECIVRTDLARCLFLFICCRIHGDAFLFKLTSLNLNGIRSAATKGLEAWIEAVRPDCICVQELKAQAADVAGRFDEIAGMKGYFHFAEKKGYSGVAIYTCHEPSDVITGYGSSEFDAEGRYVELRFDRPGRTQCPKLSIISGYFPSGSSGEERQAAKFRFLAEFYPRLLALKTSRDFVLCGDINIAHQEIDLKNFKGNKKNSGFLPEERAWMTDLLRENAEADAAEVNKAVEALTEQSGQPSASPVGGGIVDVYRMLQPTTTDDAYTWWSNRGQAYAKNVGWRLDYHLATPAFAALARSEHIYRETRFSDHAPITVDYELAF
jgi:exodeoxyribonuclease III